VPVKAIVPFVFLGAVVAAMGAIEPYALTYSGLTLLLVGALPLVFGTMSQLFTMAAGDIDLGLGAFIGLINALSAVVLRSHPFYGGLLLVASIGVYVLMGLFIGVRHVPSLVLTFGLGSVWLGIALILLPTPGGIVPPALVTALNEQTPLVPEPILICVVLAVLCYWFLMRTRLGVQLRAVGANPEAADRAGISVIGRRAILFAGSGLMGVMAGLVLSGESGSGDPNGGSSLLLLTIAAVIVGGGEFTGGEVDPIGAVAAALALSLLTSLLDFLNISANYEIGTEGLVLLVAVALRITSKWLSGGLARTTQTAEGIRGATQ
jgi:ribose/xylose/arabinose/galactoside ABC-type transport system permease subunit